MKTLESWKVIYEGDKCGIFDESNILIATVSPYHTSKSTLLALAPELLAAAKEALDFIKAAGIYGDTVMQPPAVLERVIAKAEDR